MDDQEQLKALIEYGKRIAEEHQDLTPDIHQSIEENLWNLYDTNEEDKDE